MFGRKRKPVENVPQIGPDAEQLTEPTPVGDALEQEINYTLRADKLQNQRKNGDPNDAVQHEWLSANEVAARERALAAGRSVLAELKGHDKRYWREASKRPLPTRHR